MCFTCAACVRAMKVALLPVGFRDTLPELLRLEHPQWQQADFPCGLMRGVLPLQLTVCITRVPGYTRNWPTPAPTARPLCTPPSPPLTRTHRSPRPRPPQSRSSGRRNPNAWRNWRRSGHCGWDERRRIVKASTSARRRYGSTQSNSHTPKEGAA